MRKTIVFIFIFSLILANANAVWYNPLTWFGDGSSKSDQDDSDPSRQSRSSSNMSSSGSRKKSPIDIALSLGIGGGIISNFLNDQLGLKSEMRWHNNIEGNVGLSISIKIPYFYTGLSFDYSSMPFLRSSCKSFSYASEEIIEESHHSSKSKTYCICLDIGTNFDLKLGKISPFLFVGYAGRRMSAKNGSSHNIVFDDTQDFSEKDVVDLDQKLVVTGIGALLDISEMFFLRVVFYPYFYSDIKSDYVQKGLSFRDVISGGIGTDLSFRFKSGNFGFALGYCFLKSTGNNKTYVVTDSEELIDGDRPGFKSSTWYLSFVISTS